MPTTQGALPIGTASYLAPSNAVWVNGATGADGAGRGAASAPFATISAAVTAAPNGSTVVVKAGVYREGGTTQTVNSTLGINITNKALTIQNAPGEAVWLDGSRLVSSGAWTFDSATGKWWTAYDRVFDRSPTNQRGVADGTNSGFIWVDPNNPLAPIPDQCWIDGVPQTYVATVDAATAGKFYVEGSLAGGTGTGSKRFTATKLWIGTDPTGKTVHVSDKVMCLTFNFPGNVLRGIGVRRYSNSNPDTGVLSALRSDCTYENVILEDIANDGWFIAGDMVGPRLANNVTIVNCTSNRIGGLAVGGYLADNITVDSSKLLFSNTHRWNSAPQSGAVKTSKCQFLTVRDTLIDTTYNSKGVWTDQTCHEPVVANCTLLRIGHHGIKIEVTNGATLVNNLLVGIGGHGMQFNNVGRAPRMWNNTVRNVAANRRAIDVVQDTRTCGGGSIGGTDTYDLDDRQPASYYNAPGNDWLNRDVTICNNVVSLTTAGVTSVLGVTDVNYATGTAKPDTFVKLTANGNVYHWSSAANKPSAPWQFLGATAAANAVTYQTLPAWQARAQTPDLASSNVTTGEVLDSAYRLASTTYDANAVPLPADIAALIGVPTGTKHAGAFI